MSIRNKRGEKRQLWTCVAHVKPNPGNDMLHGALGAFVPVIVLAANAEEVFSNVKKKVSSYEFMLGRIEDVELLTGSSRDALSAELLKLADSLTPENPVAFGRFHSYKQNP